MKTRLWRWLAVHFVFIIGIFLLIVLGFYRCPIQFLFDIPCPACGMTRAWLAALRLDFAVAFQYHPLFLPTPFVILYAVHYPHLPSRFQKPRLKNTVLIGFAVLFFFVYILRLFDL